ncbi:MAG: SDR family oxidoreductase [Opitutales bacterium]|nr:SDR family oxidoreductase [Opitutales bacterium]
MSSLSGVKVALFGSSGLLGDAVSRALAKRHHKSMRYSKQSTFGGAQALCLSNQEGLTRELLDTWPDAIINCAAISSPDTVIKDSSFSRKINIEGAVKLAEIASHLSARFIHVSTDMVFDGTSSPYRSTDIPNPLNEYGSQKLEAEKKVLAVTDENLAILRITLLNGNSPYGKRSPHEKILRSIQNGNPLTLFDDEMRQPCSSENVASAVVELLERPNLNGLFHWAGAEEISRYELGIRILDRFGFSRNRIIKGAIKDYHDSDSRPQHLGFELAPLVGKLTTNPSSVQEQIEELLLPEDLFRWHRQNADKPNVYIHKF